MTRPRRQRAAAAALSLALAGAGCGLDDSAPATCRCTEATDRGRFPDCAEADAEAAGSPLATRLPECPSGAMLFLREPTNPEAVLFNVRDTFEGFSAVQYMDQLTRDFLFAPDLDGLQLYPEVFLPPEGYNPDLDADTLWARAEERRFANNLLDRQRFQRIQFRRWYDASRDQRHLDPEDPRRETFLFPYEVTFTGQPVGDGTVPVLEVRGRAEVRMVSPSTENPVWSLARWQDYRDEASAKQTFTELRGAFAQ